MILTKVLIILTLTSLSNCFVSVDPTWLASSYLKSGSWKLIDGDNGGKVGNQSTPRVTLTFE